MPDSFTVSPLFRCSVVVLLYRHNPPLSSPATFNVQLTTTAMPSTTGGDPKLLCSFPLSALFVPYVKPCWSPTPVPPQDTDNASRRLLVTGRRPPRRSHHHPILLACLI
uniref:Uncharacterized protein n=1 Tax=Opuntia streptacantha TaxID=393608 RepID=A0A7C9DA27_OPUST